MATKRKSKSDKEHKYLVAIGASAGGLEAINDLFHNTPVDTGFSFVVVQHLSPDHKSLMSELLSKHTSMKVYEAEDQIPLVSNCIYLLPNKKLMTVRNGKLLLHDKTKSSLPNNAIDTFFHSLAEEYGTHAVGIILSGTGTDGTSGLESIKKHGGIAVVQDPVTAAFDGMPANAIDAGVADLILPPENIIHDLIEFINEPEEVKAFHYDTHRDELLMQDIFQVIQRETGNDFSYYKRPTLFRRLAKRLMELNIPTIREYVEYLNYHPDEVVNLSQAFLINVTYFFRDPEAFHIIETRVIPDIMKDKKPGDTVKIWSAACSSGEEAYSLAILFYEYITKNKLHDVHMKIFATDIDREALETASRGVFSKSSIEKMMPSMIEKYFTPEGNQFKVIPEIRKQIVFSNHDLLKDPPYSRMDMVLCRNMLIYINASSQKDVIRKLLFSLNVGGYLFLGPSEYTGRLSGALDEIDKKWRIYKTASKIRLQSRESMFLPIERKMNLESSAPKVKNPLNHISDLFRETLLETYEFAGIFIDTSLEVKQTAGNYKKYIEFPESGLQFNLMKLVPNDLGIALNVAIRKAMKNDETVIMRKVNIKGGKNGRLINITVKPYLKHKDYQEPFLFIVLNEEQGPGSGKAEEAAITDTAGLHKIEELEKELKETRENLQAVIEEIETSNEELQSANEEMVSTNEELQSTNEELQSLNEELHTVSAEHQQKIKELLDLNDDMNNYFNNSDIGQILVDNKMFIRRFSPAVTRMINLIPSDINRSIIDITTRFKHSDFVGDIRQVIIEGTPLEKEVVIGESCFLLRILPYVRQDKTTDGVVVNFIDITEQKKLNNLLEAILNVSPSSISALNAIRNSDGTIKDFRFVMANSLFEAEMNSSNGQVIGRKMSSFPEYFEKYFDNFCEVVQNGRNIHFESHSMSGKWYDTHMARLGDGLVIMLTDITEKKTASDLVRKSYEELQMASEQLQFSNEKLEQTNFDLMQFASVASHDLKEPLRKIQAFGNILMTKVRHKLERDEINHLDKIVNSSHRMQKLIEDVLTLSKLSNRDQVLEVVDLNEVIHHIIDDLEITIKEKNAVIKVDQLPIINAVPGQMHQVFQNLISNSIKFSGEKHPEIIISEKHLTNEQAERLHIDPREYICISVRDHGIGFEEEYRDKIFGIFQRLHGNNFEGTGIGLAICRKIIENHNGFILAESTLGEGSEFFIILPGK
mgnify:FL=1